MYYLIIFILLFININNIYAEFRPGFDEVTSASFFSLVQPDGPKSKRYGLTMPLLYYGEPLSLSVGFALSPGSKEGPSAIFGLDYTITNLVHKCVGYVVGRETPILSSVNDLLQTGVYYGRNFESGYYMVGIYTGLRFRTSPVKRGLEVVKTSRKRESRRPVFYLPP